MKYADYVDTKVVDYEKYSSDKKAFLEAHDYEYRVVTSPMDKYGTYHKEYVAEDGAIFYEIISQPAETVTVEIHKVTISVPVKFLRTEYWSSDDSSSKYYYEKF